MEAQEIAVSEEQAPEATQRDMRDLATGAAVSFAGKLGRGFRGVFMWLVPILFSMEVLGLYYTAWGLVSTLNKIGRFGLQRGVVRFVVAARAAGDQAGVERALAAAAAISLVLSAAVTVATLLSAEWWAGFYEQPIAPAIRVMALSTPFMALAWVFVAATRALRIMRYDVYVVSIAGPLILLILGGAAGFLGLGLRGIAAAQLAMAVGCCALAAVYFRRFFSLSGCLHRLGRGLPWRPLARFSFPVMVSDLLYALLTQLDALMLLVFVSPELVGLYGLARRVASAMLKAPQAFDPMFSSIVSELSHRRPRRRVSKSWSRR